MKPRNDLRCHLISYSTIIAATKGDPEALATVLNRYRGYMTKLSVRRLRDDYGNVYECLDEELRSRLELKLIAGILAFDST